MMSRRVVGRFALKAAAWTCLPVLLVLSLVPQDELVRTGAGGKFEHLAAYFLTASLFALAFPDRRPVTLAMGLVLYAAVLETAQHLAEGRHPSLADFLAGATGAVVGLAFTSLGRRTAI